MRMAPPINAAVRVRPSPRDREILLSLANRIDDADAGARNNLGVLYFNKGMLEEALEQFDRALRLDPWSEVARRNAGIAAREAARDGEVAERGSETTGAEAGDSARLWRSARLAQGASDSEAARRSFQAIIRQNSRDWAAHVELGLTERAAGRTLEAAAAFDQAVALRPDDARAQHLAGELRLELGDEEAAVARLRRAIEIWPGLAEAYAALARIYEARGEADVAGSLIRRAAEIERGRTAEAESQMIPLPVGDTGTGEVSGSARPVATAVGYLAHYHRGIRLRQKGRFADALEEFTASLEVGEQRDVVEQAMAEVLLVEGRPGDAIPLYRALLERNPQSPKLWNELGVCHHVTGALDVAIRSYTRALSCDPEYALAENNAAVALANQGDVTAAREALQSLADRGAAFPEAWSNLGLLAFQAGRREEALRAYRAAAAAAPESPAGWLGVAAVLAEEGRVGAARNAVARAVEVAPDSAEARYRLAFLLNRLGDVQGSLRETRRALSLNPYFTSPRLRLAIELQFEFSEVLAPEIGGDEGSGAVSALSDFTVRREQISAVFDRLRGGAPAGSEARGYRKATEYLARGAYQKALAEIRLVAIGGGDPVEAALLTGEALKRQGLEGEALERFDSALARLEGLPWSERHERAWLGRGECLLALSRPTLALESAAVVRAQGGEGAEVVRLEGESLLELGRAGEACDLYARLADSPAGETADLVRLAVAARRAGRNELARRSLVRALGEDPDLAAAHLELGTLCLAEGRFQEAARHGRAVLSTLPGYADAAAVVAEAERSAGDLDAAIGVLVDLLDENAYHLPTILRLGELLRESGRLEDARTAFRRVLRFDSDSAQAWADLGETYLAEGKLTEAAACHARAMASGAEGPAIERLARALRHAAPVAHATD